MTEVPIDISRAKNRLEQLRVEATELVLSQADLRRKISQGLTGSEVEMLARQLIADETAPLPEDLEARLRLVGGQISVNKKAQEILSDVVDLDELRAGHKEAVPLLKTATSHLARLEVALAAVRAILQEADVDVRAFQDVDSGRLASLRDRFKNERIPYNPASVIPLLTWREEFCGDGYNISKLDRWREEVADLHLAKDVK